MKNRICDSVYMLDLTINPSPVFSFAQDAVGACGGDSVLLPIFLYFVILLKYLKKTLTPRWIRKHI